VAILLHHEEGMGCAIIYKIPLNRIYLSNISQRP